MSTAAVVVLCSLIGTIALLVTVLYSEHMIIKRLFQENHDLKKRLFGLIREEEVRHERILNNKASFDEKCLYDLVRRVENVEKKLNGELEKKTIDVLYPKLKGDK